MAGINYTLGMDAAPFNAGIRQASSGIRTVGSMIGKVAAPLAAIAGVTSLGVAMGKAIGKAAEMETLKTAFQPLLGSAQAAQDRIDELSKFAASTPFELPAIATASRTLETLTRGALSTGDGLRVVGDVAAATNQPFDQMASTIGRLYDGLDSGRPVGEAARRLQELGVISGDTRAQLEKAQAEGKKGPEVWAIAEAAMGRFSGSMELQSQTWAGKMSTLRDNIGLTFAAFGTPIVDAIKPFLDAAIGTTETLTQKAAEFGQRVGEVIGFIAAAFQSGQMTSIIQDSFVIAFKESINFLWKTLRATISAAGQSIAEYFRHAVVIFEVLTTADFWKGMGNAIVGVFLGAISFLQKGLGEALEIARPLAELFGKGDTITRAQDTLSESASILDEEASKRFESAADPLGAAMEKNAQSLILAGENVARRFQDQFAATADVLDASANRAGLDESFAKIRRMMEENAPKPEDAPAAAIAAAAEESTAEEAAAEKAASASRSAATDRLRQIGGFVGGGINASRDRVAERTEQWTRKTAEAVEKLVTATRTPTPATSAIF